MRLRQSNTVKKISLLATGDEIANGDIVNTNASEIARRFYELGIQVGMHMVTADEISEIEKAIVFLLESHDALIMTGGLGPTSDDLTRYALSSVLSKSLIFDQTTWDNIVTRLQRFGYASPPESNRQQALFPENAIILPNPNGTAAGCFIEYKEKLIFMLPGPPSECLPMIETLVIPILQTKKFPRVFFHRSWMLFGVSEGQIAEELDALAKSFACITGYRISYPYIEFKIHSQHESDFNELAKLIDTTVKPYLISEGSQTASDMLIKKLINYSGKIHICDLATGGYLESILMTPRTYSHLQFSHDKHLSYKEPTFTLLGLTEFWRHETDQVVTPFEIAICCDEKEKIIKTTVPHRGERVRRYAAEWACYQIYKNI